ncbi:retropepsin-like aspartic protease [Glacieibacterium frigidum]|uniref:Peptidase A2 domain-containing protein n=1 Tax=Glacieibacterium frigidum TaxID=2593303 RepID=A0A552UG28_9SPHN|nr:retropepsin-like aspartic protease [Glacieibacterium frigidum]TRW17164.1 hypothetical protein FMM06_02895 [Glacieibacterium frigidum]
MIDRRGAIAGGAALLLPARALAAGVTPLRLVADRIYIDAVINGVATEALLDSGAEMTVLDRRFARRLRLGGGTAATARGTGAATAEATLVTGVTVDVAGLTLRSPTVAIIDLGDIARRLAHRRIDAIVGRDLFDASRLAIDLAAGTLAVIERRREPAGERLILTPRRGIETFPVLIEGQPVAADFDLGNGGRVLVGGETAARLLRDGRATSTVGGGGIGGETQQRTLTLRDLVVAGRRFTNVPAAVDASPTAAQANIGVRILRNFGIITDFAERLVWLRAR